MSIDLMTPWFGLCLSFFYPDRYWKDTPLALTIFDVEFYVYNKRWGLVQLCGFSLNTSVKTFHLKAGWWWFDKRGKPHTHERTFGRGGKP